MLSIFITISLIHFFFVVVDILTLNVGGKNAWLKYVNYATSVEQTPLTNQKHQNAAGDWTRKRKCSVDALQSMLDKLRYSITQHTRTSRAAAQLSESWSCSINKPGITRNTHLKLHISRHLSHLLVSYQMEMLG